MPYFPRAAIVGLGLATIAIFAAGTQAAQTKHWAYEDHGDEVGPAKWGTLPGNAACATGKQQTPIDLASGIVKPQDLPNLVFDYKPSNLSMTNNGHTVQMSYDAGSTLGRAGSEAASRSTLAQFHFHAPSEHTVDGASFPMEAHLVHLNAAGTPVAVVGVFIKAGKENAGMAKAFQSLPAKSGDKSAPAGATIDARVLLPADKTFFTYAGSLTTPPCTEGLTWFVLKTPIEMSTAQIRAFTTLEHLAHTNRPIQNLAGRVVSVDSTPGK
jgi:carbonic anhydrase